MQVAGVTGFSRNEGTPSKKVVEEEDPYKNLTPKERMMMRKEEKAR
jgi:hypothetical protein